MRIILVHNNNNNDDEDDSDDEHFGIKFVHRMWERVSFGVNEDLLLAKGHLFGGPSAKLS